MKNREIQKKLGFLFLAVTVAAASAGAYIRPADAKETENTDIRQDEKEEIVYANLSGSGSVKEVYVVNIFEVSDGKILDYGEYSEVINLKTTDELNVTGDTIEAQTEARRFYYEGILEEAELPWDIAVSYTLDGQNIEASALAGQSGALGIEIAIRENPDADPEYFENWAVQMSLTLDTDKAQNIEANGATIAEAGSDRQLTYTILPGNEKEYAITADVTDFEMDGISINGIPLMLDIDVDTDELTEMVTDLADAIDEINEGANEAADGAEELSDGAEDVSEGANDVADGASDLSDGADDLKDSASSLLSGAKSVSKGISELTDGASDLADAAESDAYEALMKENGLDVEALQEQNQTAIQNLTSQIREINRQLSALNSALSYTSDETTRQTLTQQIESYEELVESYEDIITLLTANSAAIEGAEDYMDGVAENLDTYVSNMKTLKKSYQKFRKGLKTYTSGVSDLADGAEELADGSADLADGSSDLADGSSDLAEGASKLSDGTGELYAKTDGLDTDISDQVDELMDSISGSTEEVSSFVSEKNTNVEAVQFVLQTEEIAAAETEEEEEVSDEEAAGFFQKLRSLFSRS